MRRSKIEGNAEIEFHESTLHSISFERQGMKTGKTYIMANVAALDATVAGLSVYCTELANDVGANMGRVYSNLRTLC